MSQASEDQRQLEQHKTDLRQAFDELIAQLQSARDIIDSPTDFAPPATARVLAEGYRYLAGFVHHGVERAFHEDADFPAFRNALSIFNKATIDNSDAIYFYAPIDGSKRYLVTASVADCRHWRGQARVSSGPLAPQYLIFETSNGTLAGDSGDLAELMPGHRTGFGTLDSSELVVAENGDLVLLLAPDKPEGYKGNYICTRKPPSDKHPEQGERFASYISGRQLFYDWENEQPIALTITALDHIGDHPPALTPQKTAAKLRRMGSIIHGQMKFWLHFYDVVLNAHGSHENLNNSPYFMPINAYNTPNAASSDTGGGMSTNIYAGGLFDLQQDEALYVEANFHGEPVYTSFHLGNLWGESPDYANHQSSLNHFQMYVGADGVQRWVVAHRDPGVQNWLDTTGLPKGYLSHRWAYSELPPKHLWPTIVAKKIPFDQVQQYFPADMPVLSQQQRLQAIAIRQAHVQRRYRAF